MRPLKFLPAFFTLPLLHGIGAWVLAAEFLVSPVADINSGSPSANPTSLTAFGGELFFVASGVNGRELFKTDGASVTDFDINPGGSASNPALMRSTTFGGELFFPATGANGLELFKTDGSSLTEFDINPAGSSNPSSFTKFGDHLFFAATGSQGRRLYKTDGMSISDVGDRNPGSPFDPTSFTALGDELFFVANSLAHGQELFKTDGSSITALDINPTSSSNPGSLSALGDQLFFVASGLNGRELFRTDGITVNEFDINPDGSSNPTSFTRLGGRLFFAAGPTAGGHELYTTDGTSVTELNVIPGIRFSQPYLDNVTTFGGELYFTCCEVDLFSVDLYKTDGTSVTALELPKLIDAFDRPINFNPRLTEAREFRGQLFFAANGIYGEELFKTNGTAVTQVADINSECLPFGGGCMGSGPHGFREFGGELFFAADAIGPRRELFKTNGASVTHLGIPETDRYESRPGTLEATEFGGELFFAADGRNGRELFRTDGTHVTEVGDINIQFINDGDFASSNPGPFMEAGGELFFAATGDSGRELHKVSVVSELPEPPTVFAQGGFVVSQVADITPGPGSSFVPSHEPSFAELGAEFLFGATGPNGNELFKTDGTSVTELEINPGPGSSDPIFGPRSPRLGDELFFTATGRNGRGLFKTDGTSVTELDIVPGPESMGISGELGGELFFEVRGAEKHGEGLYKTDGMSVSKVADIDSLFSPGFIEFKGKLYFRARGRQGEGVFMTDGTTTMEVEVADVNPAGLIQQIKFREFGGELFIFADNRGPQRSRNVKLSKTDGMSVTNVYEEDTTSYGYIGPLTEFDGALFMSLPGGPNGVELYKTDGTSLTELDINPGPDSSDPGCNTEFGDGLLLTAEGPNGRELFRTDGLSVTQVADINPGPDSSDPSLCSATEFGGELFFVADGRNGRELFRTDGKSVTEVADINPGPDSSSPGRFMEFGGELFFRAAGPNGRELYKTDGLSVTQVTDFSGAGDRNFTESRPFLVRELGGELFFVATGPNGRELYKTDGTSVTEFDIKPGLAGSEPEFFREFGGELFFVASGAQGRELFKVSVGLQPGDADQDLDFDQLDIVQVQIAGKYLSGLPATWGEGDWNGAPGGLRGNPPPGDGVFDHVDIMAALAPGHFLTGTYAAVTRESDGDGNASLVYDARNGELALVVPGVELTSIHIDSEAGIFTAEPAENLGGSFDNDADNSIFKATFGSSFGSLSFGNVVEAGLGEEFLLDDLSVVGSLQGGGLLGDVDLIYIPEPSTIALLVLGLAGTLAMRRRRTK